MLVVLVPFIYCPSALGFARCTNGASFQSSIRSPNGMGFIVDEGIMAKSLVDTALRANHKASGLVGIVEQWPTTRPQSGDSISHEIPTATCSDRPLYGQMKRCADPDTPERFHSSWRVTSPTLSAKPGGPWWLIQSSLTDLKGELLVVDIQGAGNDPIERGALLDVWPETGNSNQLWQLVEYMGSGWYFIQSALKDLKGESLVIDIRGAINNPTTPLQVWPKNNGQNQLWQGSVG